jgi:hypothetical protein
MLGELSISESAAPQNDVAANLSPEAILAFERLFLDWLDRYQEGLEAGGLGNPKELATLSAAWAKAYLHTGVHLGAHQHKPAEVGAALGNELQGHQEENDIERQSRLRSEIDRRSKLFLASRISPSL